MRPTSKHLRIALKIFLDIFLILAAFEAAYIAQVFLGSHGFHSGVFWYRLQVSLIYALIFVISAERLGQYETKGSLFNIQEKAGLLRCLFTTSVVFLALNSFLEFFNSFSDFLMTTFFLVVVLGVYRHFLFKRQHRKYLEGQHGRKVLIYGAGATGQLLFKKMYFMEGGDYSLVGFIDDNIPAGTELTIQRARSKARHFTATVLGGFNDLATLIRKHRIYLVIIAMPSVAAERILEIIKACIDNHVVYSFVPHLYHLRLEQVDTKNIGDIPLLKKKEYPLSFLYLLAKRIFDITLSAIFLLLFLPFFPLLALLVKLGTGGSILFKQQRVGKEGKLFRMPKFRTMKPETPEYMPSPSSNSPSQYITKIGSFLRDTNLDELPQLWNVLKGEMSIVGPRPEMPFHVEKYDDVQRTRLKGKPGLTGLWQISPDRDKEIHEHIDYDLYYINHQSFFLDLVLVLETALLTLAAVWEKVSHFARFHLKPLLTLRSRKKNLQPKQLFSNIADS